MQQTAEQNGHTVPFPELPPDYRLFYDVSFEDPSFYTLAPAFLEFSRSPEGVLLGKELVEVGKTIDALDRPEQEKRDMKKSLCMGCMLHQLNETDPEKSRVRKNERDRETDLRLPYSFHILRIFKNALRIDLSTDAMITIPLHDTREDCSITIQDRAISGNDLLEIYKREFSNYPTVPALVDMLTYLPEDLTPEDEGTVENSRIYEIALQKYVKNLTLQNQADIFLSEEGQQEIDSRIKKAVYALGRIIFKAREYAGEDDSLFLELVVKGLLLKALDSYDNMGSKGMRPPAYLRNRILIHAMRILGSNLADRLMERFIKNDPTDPFNPAETYKHVSAQIKHPETTARMGRIRRVLKDNNIRARVKKRFQVSISDETAVNPAPQLVIHIDGDKIEEAQRLIQENAQFIFGSKKAGNTVTYRPIEGILHHTMRRNGRKTRMGLVCETTTMKNGSEFEALKAYIRLDGDPKMNPFDHQDGWRYAQQNQAQPEFSHFPEAPIFFVPAGSSLADALEVVTALYEPTIADYRRMLTHIETHSPYNYNQAN